MSRLAAFLGFTAISLLIGGAAADSGIVIPDAYRIGKSPVPLRPAINQAATIMEKPAAKIERAAGAGIDGAFWAEIFPVFDEGSSGNSSYFRLGAGPSASTFHIMIVGSPSGDNYGEGDIAVPANATPQYALSDFLTAAKAGALANSDTAYSIYISNPAQDSFYQHVIYNGTNRFFEDVTICPVGASVEGGRTVTNAHSSILSAFPSTIYVHNMVAVEAEYSVNMRDSRTGALMGTLPSLKAAANSTYAIPESYFESQLRVTPNSSQQHLTFEFHATPAFALQLGAGADPVDVGGIFGLAVLNQQFGAVLNLSNKCLVNR